MSRGAKDWFFVFVGNCVRWSPGEVLIVTPNCSPEWREGRDLTLFSSIQVSMSEFNLQTCCREGTSIEALNLMVCSPNKS